MSGGDRSVLAEIGAAMADPASMAEAQRFTHDHMLAEVARVGRRPAGPVEWRWFAADFALEALAALRLADHPNAPGLLEWLAEHPGGQLLIATVVTELAN